MNMTQWWLNLRKVMRSNYRKGQEDLISYIRAHITFILKNSKKSDKVLDLINFLKNLRPLDDNLNKE